MRWTRVFATAAVACTIMAASVEASGQEAQGAQPTSVERETLRIVGGDSWRVASSLHSYVRELLDWPAWTRTLEASEAIFVRMTFVNRSDIARSEARADIRLSSRGEELGVAEARRIYAALPQALTESLRKLTGDPKAFIERSLERRRAELKRVNGALEALEARVATLREQAEPYELSTPALEKMLQGWKEELRQIEYKLDQAEAPQAALDVLEARMAKHEEERRKDDESGEIITKLKRIAEIRERLLAFAQVRHENGALSSEELDEAEEAWLKAKAAVEGFRAQRDSGPRSREPDFRVVAAVAGHKARRAWLQERIEDVEQRGILALAREYERELWPRFAVFRERRKELNKAISEREEALREWRPITVELVGGAK